MQNSGVYDWKAIGLYYLRATRTICPKAGIRDTRQYLILHKSFFSDITIVNIRIVASATPVLFTLIIP